MDFRNDFEKRVNELMTQEVIESPDRWIREVYKNRILDALEVSRAIERAYLAIPGSSFRTTWLSEAQSFLDAVALKILDSPDARVYANQVNERVHYIMNEPAETIETNLYLIIAEIDLYLAPPSTGVHSDNPYRDRVIALLSEDPIADQKKWIQEIFKYQILDALEVANRVGRPFAEEWRSLIGPFRDALASRIGSSEEAVRVSIELEDCVDHASSVYEGTPRNGRPSFSDASTKESEPLLRLLVAHIDFQLSRSPAPSLGDR